jgi:hypothetical protein
MRILVIMLLLLGSVLSHAAVRWNPHYRVWEGNVCMNSAGWQIVEWQPLGSLCIINLPGLRPMQGIIVNV